MGIRGLAGYLKWQTPDARKALDMRQHAGQRWAIDTSCILYRARAAGLSPITVVASLLVRMKAALIVPVFIFDGKPPAAKAEVIEERRIQRETAQKEITALEHILDTSANMTQMDKAMTEKRMADLRSQVPTVTSSDKDQIKQLLYGAGVLFLSAAGEADDLLGVMARGGLVQAVMSTDMDMLGRGVEILVVPDTADTTIMTVIRLSKILQKLRLTYAQFVEACVLMGTDYTGRDFVTMKPPDAVGSARQGLTFTDPLCLNAVRMLTGADTSLDNLLIGAQKDKWTSGPPEKEPETLKRLASEHGWPPAWITGLT